MTHRGSQYLALGGLVVLLVLYALTNFGLLGPNPVGSTSNDIRPLLVPPGWAFSIWGPIYLGLIVFPVYQLVRNRNNHELWIPLRRWYAANVVTNGVWLAFASYDWQLLTVVTIAFLLFTLLRIQQLYARLAAAGATYSYWAGRVVFSVYFGWVTLATVLNVATALLYYGWSGGALGEVAWSLIMTAMAAGIAGFTAYRFRDSAYALVPVWAFGALATRHWASLPTLAYSSVAVAIGFFILAATLFVARPKKQVVAS